MDATHDHAEIDRHVKAALLVFGSLLFLTAATVGAYELGLPTRIAIAVALVIATVKGSLVAGWFMHLVSERTIVYAVLLLTLLFFVPLLLFPTFTVLDAVRIH
jgi:cytochrome c oxidase subunit IV